MISCLLMAEAREICWLWPEKSILLIKTSWMIPPYNQFELSLFAKKHTPDTRLARSRQQNRAHLLSPLSNDAVRLLPYCPTLRPQEIASTTKLSRRQSTSKVQGEQSQHTDGSTPSKASPQIRNNLQNIDRYNASLWARQDAGLNREQSRRQYLEDWTRDWTRRNN